VDDDREARRVLNLYLKDVAERTYSAEDGESALETYHEQPLDLVLLDVEMPGMDGVEVTERIRRHEKEQQLEPVPIILQSALAVGDTAEKSIEAGASEFLTKPVDRTNLYRTMLDVLKKSSDGTD
jgi:CheY-like chemotaxis protein